MIGKTQHSVQMRAYMSSMSCPLDVQYPSHVPEANGSHLGWIELVALPSFIDDVIVLGYSLGITSTTFTQSCRGWGMQI